MKTDLVLPKRIKDQGDFGNDITIRGNLGCDPRMSYTPSGNACTKFSVAVWGGKEKTMWMTVTTWGDLAEACAEQLLWQEEEGKKSPYVQVKGYLVENTYKGVKYYNVTGNHVTILERPVDVPVVTVSEEEKKELNELADMEVPF